MTFYRTASASRRMPTKGLPSTTTSSLHREVLVKGRARSSTFVLVSKSYCLSNASPRDAEAVEGRHRRQQEVVQAQGARRGDRRSGQPDQGAAGDQGHRLAGPAYTLTPAT